MNRTDIRLALPSKGRLEPESLEFLDACSLRVYKPNPRQYQASIPAIPNLAVLFQRPGDIVVGVRAGSLDFGIAGLDIIAEKKGDNGDVLILHDELGFGFCSLVIAVPEAWIDVSTLADLDDVAHAFRERHGRRMRLRVTNNRHIVSFHTSGDDGKTWHAAKLGKDLGRYSFREWHAEFTPKAAGDYMLKVRATNTAGDTQPLDPLWNPAGYMRNVVEAVRVTAA